MLQTERNTFEITPLLDSTTMKNNTDFTQRTFQRESLGGETRAKEEKKNEPNNRRRLFHSTGTPLQTRSRPLNVFICSTSNLLVEKKKDFESISRTPYLSSKNDNFEASRTKRFRKRFVDFPRTYNYHISRDRKFPNKKSNTSRKVIT
ncbi:hypothetical protein HZH66_006350 [Vespula vulgaris]|uniref:Uncharacterized protein n=1 Tax=Vespula vulgaris TaxID=7454 RepID=A0A834K1C2_VESVU|nr:hypothetical protein HZH66_006350 [Vespula vulgaris]